MISLSNFPTPLHRQVAELAGDFFGSNPLIDTVLVVNSCARGQAIPESDLDMAVLMQSNVTIQQIEELERSWAHFWSTHPLFHQFQQSGPFMQLHLDIIDGRFAPTLFDDGGGPDAFELEVGNRIAYGVPLYVAGAYFQQLQAHWLPYYDDELRLQRLEMVRKACAYDLDHVPFYQKRGLYFQAFDRLYKAFQEFLQALFIARRTYPLAYNKWIREQVEQWLAEPELYKELPRILSVRNIESSELSEKADALHHLLANWTQP